MDLFSFVGKSRAAVKNANTGIHLATEY